MLVIHSDLETIFKNSYFNLPKLSHSSHILK